MESKADSMRYQLDESSKKYQELEEHLSTSVELLKNMLQQQHMQMQPPKSPLRPTDMQPDRMHCEEDGNTLSVKYVIAHTTQPQHHTVLLTFCV